MVWGYSDPAMSSPFLHITKLICAYNNWVNYLRRVVHQLLVRVILRVESKEFHAVGHQLSKYMKNNTIVNQG